MPVAFTDMTLSKSSSDCSARNDSAFDTGVVARAVKSTKGCHGACDQTLDVRSVGDVCLNKNCVSRLLSYESNRFAASIAVQIGHNNLGTFVCKFERSSTANPRPLAGHKSYLPRHKAHWLSRRPNIQNSYSRAGLSASIGSVNSAEPTAAMKPSTTVS